MRRIVSALGLLLLMSGAGIRSNGIRADGSRAQDGRRLHRQDGWRLRA